MPTTEPMQRAPFRVAIRESGESVQLFIAKPDTMKDAAMIMTMAKSVAYLSEEVRDAIHELAAAIGKGLLAQYGVEAAGIITEDAPASERPSIVLPN